MSYSQSKKSTNTEKKLQALKTQLYGKERSASPSPSTTIGNFHIATTQGDGFPKATQTVDVHSNYLKHDLLKIALLATLAVSAQIIVYLKFH